MHGVREHESLALHACILRGCSNVPSRTWHISIRHQDEAKMTSEERRARRRKRREKEHSKRRKERLGEYDSYERVASMDSLYKAADAAQKGVSWKASVQRYNMSRMMHIYRTHEDLMSGKDIRKGFICFDIVERGKLRHIKSVRFSERVVQKSICQNALSPILTNPLIYDNGANQKGKGTQFSLNRLVIHLTRHVRRHGREGGILLIDFSDYFGRIDHEALHRMYEDAIHDDKLRALALSFVDAFGDKGLGLGSETSQINAIYLRSPLDHYIKEILRIKGYGAYMDDSYLIHDSISYLKECLKQITEFCARYGIVINPVKTKICDLKHGFTFLKTRFFITGTGHIIKKPCREAITRERRKLKRQKGLLDRGELSFDAIRTSYASWRGSMIKKDAYNATRNMDDLFDQLFIDSWRLE